MDSSPPAGDTSIAPRTLLVSGTILAAAFTIYSVRVYTRLRPKYNLHMEDYLVTLAMAMMVITFSLTAVACQYGLGRYDYYVSPEDRSRALHYTFVFGQLGPWASTFIRISVAFMLLRFKTSQIWRRILWVAIIFQVLATAGGSIASLCQCSPLRANWDAVPDARCENKLQMEITDWVVEYQGITILDNILFSFMPIILISMLSRPLLERILVSILMASGFFATAGVIVRLCLSKSANQNPNLLRSILRIAFWCRIEESVLTIGACVPLLKSPIQKILGRLGVPSFKNMTRDLNEIDSKYWDNCQSGSV
ncbi:hypothetical protein DL95DRAFT_312816 [Leptodontidium sp. 2 PMI_412]|nr:hypothetical protein DL95DRAFT_312816 [Leptodontidium sp. 2 PMI_412]